MIQKTHIEKIKNKNKTLKRSHVLQISITKTKKKTPITKPSNEATTHPILVT
jgi:hypothetical protein